MKTTIDIPEPLYKQVKIRAVETGWTLKKLVLVSLRRELGHAVSESGEGKSFQNRRKFRPAYAKAAKAGAFRPAPGARDVTDLISEDRDGR